MLMVVRLAQWVARAITAASVRLWQLRREMVVRLAQCVARAMTAASVRLLQKRRSTAVSLAQWVARNITAASGRLVQPRRSMVVSLAQWVARPITAASVMLLRPSRSTVVRLVQWVAKPITAASVMQPCPFTGSSAGYGLVATLWRRGSLCCGGGSPRSRGMEGGWKLPHLLANAARIRPQPRPWRTAAKVGYVSLVLHTSPGP
mmetsp:Transcript_20863/g.37568  ORF Transcript_20863/g.37568 Transcript_20863/m.37568 type:complete len:204 (+) Transcript_20863:400-1011(+)